ncbi:hypothetical protein ACFLYY_02670, partial [Patescibacteria group bacterium]
MTYLFDFISEAIGGLFRQMLEMIASFLPSIGNAVSFTEAIPEIVSIAYQLSFVIPWGILFTVLWLSIQFEITMFLLRFLMWLIRLI